jgi:HlyD family secretion protein
MKKKIARVVILLLGATTGALWWFDVLPGFERSRHSDGRLTLYGNVDIRQVQLGFRVGGRIVEVLVEEGDAVKAGDVIARLDAQPYEDAHRASEASVATQKAVLDKLEAGPRPAEIAQARAMHEERLADRDNAELAFNRSDRLRPTGVVAQATLDQARAARDMAIARVTSAREGLRLLEEGTRWEDIAAARATLQGTEANFAATLTSLRDTQLLAPSHGVILSRVREPGAIVAPGEAVYVLSLAAPVWVRAYVAEPYLGRIHPGMTVEVTSDSAPARPYRGTIGFISPVAEFTPKSVETPELRTDLVYRLRVIIDRPDAGLRQGMPMTVHVPSVSAGGA